MSKVVRLPRVFRPRLEVEHRQSASSCDWEFSMHHVSDRGRRFLGIHVDVALAFAAALAWRNLGVRIVFVDGGQP